MLNWKQKAINAKAGKRKSLQYMPVSYCAAVWVLCTKREKLSNSRLQNGFTPNHGMVRIWQVKKKKNK